MLSLPIIPQSVATNAAIHPDKLAACDSRRSITYREWDERSNRLANALMGVGLRKGDRVAVLAYNCIEWTEIYVALGKAGLITVPVNFRLTADEIRYIVEDSGATAFIVQDELTDSVEEIRDELEVATKRYIRFGQSSTPSNYQSYESLIAAGQPRAPNVEVAPPDPWAIVYTSGTTGKSKGAIRSHGSHSSLGLVVAYDMGFAHHDTGFLVMPMFHVNSFYFMSAYATIGGTCYVYDRKSFDPEHFLRTLAAQGAAFTSLVPTHYIMMLGLPNAVKASCDVSQVRKLLISSAPARRETKLAIMEYFGNAQLFEGYGSTEAGFVTLLRPDEQLTHLGSIGRELTCCARTRLLDDNGVDVPEGEPGELFSHTPFVFDGYWNLPEKTSEAFRGPYCSVGDMARRDEQGFYYLVDRKSNMIISGGENVYPSEVESLLGRHPAVKDVAVIGIPHEKWGESVHAVVIVHDDRRVAGKELLEWCRTRIAGYKRPRSVSFIGDDEMPRTATGKILHRLLRDRIQQPPDDVIGKHICLELPNSRLGAAPIFGGALLGVAAGQIKGPDFRGTIKTDLELLDALPPDQEARRTALQRTIDQRIDDLIAANDRSRALRAAAASYQGNWRDIVLVHLRGAVHDRVVGQREARQQLAPDAHRADRHLCRDCVLRVPRLAQSPEPTVSPPKALAGQRRARTAAVAPANAARRLAIVRRVVGNREPVRRVIRLDGVGHPRGIQRLVEDLRLVGCEGRRRSRRRRRRPWPSSARQADAGCPRRRSPARRRGSSRQRRRARVGGRRRSPRSRPPMQ